MRFLRDAAITFILIVVAVWIVAYAKVRAGGLSADAQPGRVERFIARNLVRLSLPADATRLDNPFGRDPDAWRSAAKHFEDHCASCHGRDGRGRTAISESLYPKVPDLSEPVVQRLTDGELFYIIQNGVRWTGMPAWKREHSIEETWRLVSFVRKVPVLTEQDIKSLAETSDQERHEHDHQLQHERGQRPPDR